MVRTTHLRRRRGAILLVVLTLLALFAVVGLSFALYAQSEAQAARIKRETVDRGDAKPDPYPAINAFLGQLLFDTSDTGPDAMSALRGHSLARGRYGYPAGIDTTATPPKDNLLRPNTAAYGGSGPFSEPLTLPGVPGTPNRDAVINFAFYPNPSNPYVIDPEWKDGIRSSPSAARPGIATYVGKNAAYTYPDLNNAFLAVVDPLTGKVEQPSFHRNWLFDLSSANADWTSAVGRLKVLRPRPDDHAKDPTTGQPLFPFPPRNPDGTVTGDVQNLRYTNGLQRNDSVWLNVNAPVFDYKGKKVQALIAPLILDLNARVNLNAAGPVGAQTATNKSSMGFGPHEINLSQLLLGTQTAAELDAAARAKYGNNASPTPASPTPPSDQYTAQATAKWNNGRQPPQYGLLAWNTTTNQSAKPTLPAPGGLSPFPTFPNGSGYVSTSATDTLANQQSNHPAQYNPNHWPTYPGAVAPQTPTAHAFGPDELRLLFSHFSWSAAKKPGTELATTFGTNLGQTGPAATGNPQASGFARMALTTFSNTGSQYTLDVAAIDGATRFTAKLPPIDLGRVLPDFRRNDAQPYGLSNVYAPAKTVMADYGSYAKARQARQNFARDVFVRLAAVTQWGNAGNPPTFPVVDGTNVAYNPATGYLSFNLAALPPAQSQVLRLLAQAAANVVDYLDPDDLMTTFVWNPTLTGGYVYDDKDAAVALGLNPQTFPDPSADPALFQNAQGLQYIADRVVFGFEVPRVVIHEAFAAVTNDRSETYPTQPPLVGPNRIPQQNFKKKFWAELMNPLPTDTDPVLSDSGAARLQVSMSAMPAPPGATSSFNPYQFEVYEQSGMGGTTFAQYLQGNPGNVTGDPTYSAGPPSPFTKVVEVTDYQTANGQPSLDASWSGGEIDQNFLVKPIGTSGPVPPQGNKGFFVLGPQDDLPEAPPGSSQVSSRLPDSPVRAGPMNKMLLDTGVKTQNDIANLVGTSNTFVLRRLANPYAPPNPPGPTFNSNQAVNPYITVDVQDQVPTADRIDWDGMGMNRHSPAVPDVQSVGKRHPYAAANLAPQGMIVPGMGMNRSQVANTFFATNTGADNAQGFAWLAHLDRPPVNGVELGGVSFYGPAAVTAQFWQGGNYQGHTAAGAWAGNAPNSSFQNLYKALAVLTVRSHLTGIPVGGPEPGKVNPNTVWDNYTDASSNNYSRILMAVADPNASNQFAATDVVRMWSDIKAARTLAGANAGKTLTDDTASAGTDRPFRGFHTTTNNVDDTLLRKSPPSSTNTPAPIFGMNPTPGANSHPLFQAEPLRKMLNSLTPTSDSFLVLVTVGFFEVNGSTTSGTFVLPKLGKEVYDEIPGDLRVQFGAVVDRGMMTVANTDTQANATKPGPAPWFTALAADVLPDDVAASGGLANITVSAAFDAANNAALLAVNGQPQRISAGDRVRVGFGDYNSALAWAAAPDGTDGEWVRVRSVANGPANSGTVTLTVMNDAAPGQKVFYRPHPVGSPVSNAILGNPGPQPGFDYRNAAYRAVLPVATGAFPVPKP